MKPPLRTVLRNFLNHFEDYEARKKLCDDQYEHEFQQLKNLTDTLKNDSDYSCWCAFKDVNRPKNRYKDIVPYDKSRVVLPKCDGIPGSDYINASHIKGASGAFAYIAAQGPLPNTVIDFWRMIWLCDVQVVVMACNEFESGKVKCEKYWPSKGEVKHYGNISVELINTSQVCPDFLIRTLLVKCDSEMRDVYQFHYTSWPDHGIPDTVQPILELVRLMRQCQASETMPIVVHCSAGCGRTGTICAVDFVWACLRHGKLSEDFSLFQIALELRRQRIAMIQTKEQYILAHKAVATLFEQQLNVIDCHPYVNLDEDGEPLIWKELTKNKRIALKEKSPLAAVDNNKERKLSDASSDLQDAINGSRKVSSSGSSERKESSARNSLHNISNIDYLNKKESEISISDTLANSSRNSESSFSRNSYLSQQSNEDGIPFIDEDDVCVRPQGGRAYLHIPSCDSISKLVNRFDPFVDRVAFETDESSPEADSKEFSSKSLSFEGQKNNTITSNVANVCDSKSNSENDPGQKSINPKSSTNLKDTNTSIVECSYKGRNVPFVSKRESYPSACIRDAFEGDSADDIVSIQSENIKGTKKVGRAMVVRRPSISKLKALFERSSISSSKQNEGGKRLLFRSNTHHVSRAGSAPPCLNCMGKDAAVEKESILMMVTRKFRSSSVRTEREINSKSCAKSQKKMSQNSITNFKEGFATLSRTVSFNLNKTFRNNLPTTKTENSTCLEDHSTVGVNFENDNNKSKVNPSTTKSKSMWYDKSSLPRVVAVVKPTEKSVPSNNSPKSPTFKNTDKNKSEHVSFPNKPPKLLPFLSGLSKTDGKDTTMWYSETDNTYVKDIPTTTQSSVNEPEPETTRCGKVLPFIHSLKPWKKIVSKTALSSPDSPKSPLSLQAEFSSQSCSSTFYDETPAINNPSNSLHNNPSIDNTSDSSPNCPVPEEIIPLSLSNKPNAPSVSSGIISDTKKSESCIVNSQDLPPVNTLDLNKSSDVQPTKITDVVINENDKVDVPPAIPKKMHIGKNKQFDCHHISNESLKSSDKPEKINLSGECLSSIKSVEDTDKNTQLSSNDLYINVNETAKKNIEQIENAIRISPRSAIIDLTSRESYCMEEELAIAVKQLPSPKSAVKPNSKFPGYEVIWPETKNLSNNYIKSIKGTDTQYKTGICYSPPLRRSFNSSLGISKSSSCSNIDWLEPCENIALPDNLKDCSPSPTKKLVKEAAVELNTLLDRLTTQTLSEANDFDSKDKPDVLATNSSSIKKSQKAADSHMKEIDKDTLLTHSVTLVSKSYPSDSSPKEEEIVFHFPPPPPIPPPKDDTTSESFDIVVKNGSIVVLPNKTESENGGVNNNAQNIASSDCKSTQVYPQPAPRKSKIRKSASYTNLWAPQSKGYENVFLEKFQTLSRLQIESNDQNNSKSTTMGSKPTLKSEKPLKKTMPNYVNISNIPFSIRTYADRNSSETKSASKCTVENTSYLKEKESFLSKEKHENKLLQSNTKHGNLKDVDMSRSYPESSFIGCSFGIESEKDKYATYGKIQKLSNRKNLKIEDDSTTFHDNIMKRVHKEAKRQITPSKKSERAPLPPDSNLLPNTKDKTSKMDSSDKVITKRIPSRKQEKAPLPPPMLQKSSSTANVPKKSGPNTPYYINFSNRAQYTDETHTLPAVRENITNTDSYSKFLLERQIFTKEHKNSGLNRGLSHSQSDASVFLALKERKTLSLNREQKLPEANVQITNKILKRNKELPSVSSSDSDSSYERIFFEKPGERSEKFSRLHQRFQEQSILEKKELPIAPPRARRRNTTDIHYAKVQSKDKALLLEKAAQKERLQNEKLVTKQESPPAIPMKTRDAFEAPESVGNKEREVIKETQENESRDCFKL